MGIEDFLGAPGSDQSQAMGLLAAGLYRGDMGGGLLAANQFYADAPDRKLKRSLLESQVAENQAQAKEREQKMRLALEAQANQQRMLYGDPAGVSPGAFFPSADGNGPVMPQGAAPQAGGLIGRARSLGMPEDVIQADIAFNGGKKISEFLNARSTPKWENINGNLVNTNAQGFQGGFQPGFSVSASGQAMAWMPDGKGGLVFGAPTGALDAYRAYQNVGEQVKANLDPFQIPPSAANPRPVLTTRGAFAAGQQPPANRGEAGMRAQIAEPMGADPEAIKREIKQTVADLTNKPLDASSRQALEEHVRNMSQQLAAIQGGAPVQTAQSGGIPLQSSAEKIQADEQAKADVMPTQQRKAAVANADYLSSVVDMALKHPGLSTATGLQGTLDPRNYIPGTNATNFKTVLDQIKGSAFMQAYQNLKGGGQITEVEGKKATDAIARLNTAQSTEEFTNALNDFKSVVEAGKSRLTGGEGGIRPTVQAPPAPTVGMIRSGYRFKGGNPADPKNWEQQ